MKVIIAILNETVVTFIGFGAHFSRENDDDFPKSSKNISMRTKFQSSSVTKSFNFLFNKAALL